MQNALEIRNLSKKYTDFTLDKVNLTLPKGCIMGFIGENGAGKSTTIKLVLDLVQSDTGEVCVLGANSVANNKSIKENIGVVMDESSFPDNLNILNINGIMKKCYKTWDSERFLRFADKFALPLKKPVSGYSKGMKMKLSIAVALSHDCKLLILDEATSGLDPIARDEILDVFLEFIQDENNSILVSSHIISDLEKICDYITFIHKGKIIFSEQKDELKCKYTIIKCTQEEYKTIDTGAIIGTRKNAFGVECLALRDKVSAKFTTDNPTIEDIMLYYVKGDK